MIGLLSPVLGVAKAIPWWAWALAACLAWGGWNRHQARSAGETLRQAQAAATADEALALKASIAETERRLAAQAEVTREAQAKAESNARAAAAARAAADRVRSAAAAFAASAAASGAAAAGDCPAADAASGVLADLLGRTANRAAELADMADRARAAGLACERAYDALNGVTR